MHVAPIPTPSARIHDPISSGVAPNARAAWNTSLAELVNPTSTVTKPAATAASETSRASDMQADSDFARQRLLLRLQEGAPESERIPNAGHRRERIATARNDDRTEIEHAPHDALLDLHTFDLRHIQLDRVSADKTELGDNALARHCEFGRAVFDQGGDQDEQADHDRGQQHTEKKLRKKRPQADAAQVKHLLALHEGLFDVARHWMRKKKQRPAIIDTSTSAVNPARAR